MASATSRDKMEFAYLMAKHSTASLYQLQRLLRYGATLHRLAEAHCNGDCTVLHDYDGTGHDCPKQERIQAAVTKLCLEFDAKPFFQNDPRGCTVKIVVPDGYTNDMGREGICVPTS